MATECPVCFADPMDMMGRCHDVSGPKREFLGQAIDRDGEWWLIDGKRVFEPFSGDKQAAERDQRVFEAMRREAFRQNGIRA